MYLLFIVHFITKNAQGNDSLKVSKKAWINYVHKHKHASGLNSHEKMPYLSGMNLQLFPWSSPGFPYLSFNIYLVCIHLVTISQPAPTRFVVPALLQSEQKRFDRWELPLALFHFFTSCSLLVLVLFYVFL